MVPQRRIVVLYTLAACAIAPGVCRAQGPTIGPAHLLEPGSMASSLGPTPGAGANPFGNAPGAGAMVLSGRPGPSTPHLPSQVLIPPTMAPVGRGISAPRKLPITKVPVYGPLELPDAAETEGPADGLSLDAAIERLVRQNLDLRAKAVNIPLARADVLTAGLRANPILYADGQLVPYGRYNRSRAGGPTQYDLDISHPFDLTGKRQARTRVAESTVSVLEAQFQDAVRLQIDNLYTAFIDVLAARETIRYAEASVAGLDRVLDITRLLYRRADARRPDVDRIRVLGEAAALSLDEAQETLRHTRRVLAALLNVPPAQADALEVRGLIGDEAPEPPDLDELVRLAQASRPDLAAYRLGLGLADADERLARANRFGDVYLLYQPYTFQNLQPFGLKSATSFALGATVPLPVYHRNQGGIERAQLNVDQTRMELAGWEHRVAAEVTHAAREYAMSRAVVRELERIGLPAARSMRGDTLRLYTSGELDALAFLKAQRDYNELARQYRDALLRHRRSMLSLNTAVGLRILP
ncbi:MAG: TolC family protein [Isosphaeraceae bacterium]|nr:TolC family protein [Isosphaeraceae bacterium]